MATVSKKINGNLLIRQNLARLCNQGKLHSCIMLYGEAGIGKSLIAKELASNILCETKHELFACESCDSCRLIQAGNHPDLIYIDCKSDDANAEGIREILNRISFASFRGKARVLILDHSEELSSISANALLKSLEEPGKNLYFILVCSNPARLPKTIISRSQLWALSQLKNDELNEAIEMQNLDPQILELLPEVNDGTMKTIELLNKHLEVWQLISEQLHTILRTDQKSINKLIDLYIKSKDDLFELLELTLRYFRNVQINKASQKNALIVQDLITAIDLINQRNANSRLVLHTLFCNYLSQSGIGFEKDLIANRVI